MSTIKTNGHAFPVYLGNKENWDLGMTLRDYFAGQALAGSGEVDYVTIEIMAKRCYEISDAMIKARGEQ